MHDTPKISIITPSFQQACFLEETIQSVLSQAYPNLEYIIIDGGSSDGSIDIIRRYEKYLTYWVSEADKGQTHAINKGLSRASGSIIAYLNSDDYYLPGSLRRVADFFLENEHIDIVHGKCRIVDQNGKKLDEKYGSINSFEDIVDVWNVWLNRRCFVQPEVFWRRRISDRVGPFREELYYVMDFEYWARILRAGGVVGSIDAELSCFRVTGNQKTSQWNAVMDELLALIRSWIWDQSAPISSLQRLRLKGKWLFEVEFSKELNRSVVSGESSFSRWARMAGYTIMHPNLLACDSCWRWWLNRHLGWVNSLLTRKGANS